MQLIIKVIVLIFFLNSAASGNCGGNFTQFLEDIKKESLELGFTELEISAFLEGVSLNPKVLEAEIASEIRGLVDLYDGDKHLQQCLIVASTEENGIVHFEYKRKTATTIDAPKDFYQEKKLAGLISQSL